MNPGAKVLDIGSGSGYLSAVLYHLVSTDDHAGKVVGIEHVSELVDWSRSNLKQDGLANALEDKNVEIIVGDGREGKRSSETLMLLCSYSWPLRLRCCRWAYLLSVGTMFRLRLLGGPYDAIHVGAAAPSLPPALVEQLAQPGRMFIPVGTYTQNIIQVDKDPSGKVTEKEIMGVRASIYRYFQVTVTHTPT